MTLHEKLVKRQTLDELKRKALKARRRGIWTREDIDYAQRKAQNIHAWLSKAFL
jgi:hypothetical protein